MMPLVSVYQNAIILFVRIVFVVLLARWTATALKFVKIFQQLLEIASLSAQIILIIVVHVDKVILYVLLRHIVKKKLRPQENV